MPFPRPRFTVRRLMIAVAVVAVVLAIIPKLFWAASRSGPVAPKRPKNRAEAVAYANVHYPNNRPGYIREIVEVDPSRFGGTRYIIFFVKPGQKPMSDGTSGYELTPSGYDMMVGWKFETTKKGNDPE